MNRWAHGGSSQRTSIICPSCQAVVERGRRCSSCGLPLAPVKRIARTGSSGAGRPPCKEGEVFLGRVLDSKYELTECLGIGGMGTVYRARRLHIGDDVA